MGPLRPLMRSWLANPVYSAYPAISQQFLLQGWRLQEPVYLDVIVWNYEHAFGITSPRDVADVELDVLKAAILEGSNTRYGTQVTDFEQLLKRWAWLIVRPLVRKGKGRWPQIVGATSVE